MQLGKTDLLKGAIVRSLLFFALPLFVSNIFQQLYNTMDIMIVGNYLGDVSLAAIGASSAVYDLLVGFALGIGNGLSMVAARSFGSGDRTLLKRSVAASLVIGAAVTLMIMGLSRICLIPLLELLHTPADIIQESYSYISTITLFVGVMFAYNLCAGLLRAIGNSLMPLVFLILSSGLNIVLDLLFITRFSMGIRGAAVATVIAQGSSAILCLFYIFRKCSILVPEKKHFRIQPALYQELLGQGFSMAFMMAIVSTGTVILQSGINRLGSLVIAGHVAARKLNSLCIMPVTTMAMSLSTFVSQNKGADQGERIRKSVRCAIILDICWGILISAVLYFTAPILVKILSGSSENVIISNGARYLRINSLFYPVLGILSDLRYSLQGIGQKILPLVSSIIEFFGKIVFVIFLIPYFGYWGVIFCEPLIWCVMCSQLIWAFYRDPYIRKFGRKPCCSVENSG